MPIPAGPGGQQEAWRGPGAAAGLFWRPVTLAQIPPRPQECRSLPSPSLAPPPRPLRQSQSVETERARSERASEAASEGEGGGQGCSVDLTGPLEGVRTDTQTSLLRTDWELAGRADWARKAGAQETHKHPNSDSRTLTAHTWTGRQRHARSPGN